MSEQLSWRGIAEVVAEAMARFEPAILIDVVSVLAVDAASRDVTRAIVGERMAR